MPKEHLHANGIDIRVYTENYKDEFISLTDIAKYRNSDDPRFVIQNWMRNKDTIEFLGLWETLHNPNFNRVQFDTVKQEAGLNRFTMTPQRWISEFNAVGIVSKAGRYGGTYAVSDIAFEFASWISPEFKLYIIKDYQRLKIDESNRLSLDWNLKREMSKLNYRIHTDAIKETLIPKHLSQKQIGYKYASEADLLNVVVFGMTAKEWKTANRDKKGNIRDHATIEQLLVLSNLESYNATLIKEFRSQSERIVKLRKVATEQMKSLERLSTDNLKSLENKK